MAEIRVSSRIWSLAIAVALAFGLLFATRQITPGGWYASQPAYRAQVDALLDGRLALTPEPAGLYHDLAWTPSGTQQVWGLGAPLLQLPFEAIGRVIGWSPFPDRIAMAAWLAFALFVLLRAFPGWAGAGVLLLTAFTPPIITMLRGRCEVYEDAALYAYTAALVLLAGLVIFARAPSRWRYLALLAAAGATGLIRPTVWFYGAGTAIAATVLWWRAGGRRSIVVGALLFVLGGGALYATNAMRFGRGGEFGHSLNIESLPGNITATRFSYPFQRVGTVEATKELVGALFGRPERNAKRGFYNQGLHVWQSATPRWREYYFTTYSWAWIPLLLAGVVLGGLAIRRRERDGAMLLGWALVGAGPLCWFYLHSPSVSSRYQLDLAPAFAALLLIGWRALAARISVRWSTVAVGVVWALAVVLAKPSHRPEKLGFPTDLEGAMSFVDSSRVMPDAHPDVAGMDLDDPLVPTLTQSEQQFERCANEIGERIDCKLPRVGGDLHYAGAIIERRWFVHAAETVEEWDACGGEPRLFERDAGLLMSLPVYYLNAFRWDLDDRGGVPPSTVFYLRDPQFFELEVRGGDPAKVRVAVGLTHLTPVSTVSTARGVRIRFEAPQLPPGLSVAFVAFGDDTSLDRDYSAYDVLSVRWRAE